MNYINQCKSRSNKNDITDKYNDNVNNHRLVKNQQTILTKQ